MYRMVAPIVRLSTTKSVPIHFPNIKPPANAIGVPNPKRITQSIVITISKNDIRKKFCSLNKIIFE